VLQRLRPQPLVRFPRRRAVNAVNAAIFHSHSVLLIFLLTAYFYSLIPWISPCSTSRLTSKQIPTLGRTREALRKRAQRSGIWSAPVPISIYPSDSYSQQPKNWHGIFQFELPGEDAIGPLQRSVALCFHSIRRVEIQSTRAVAIGSIARFSHQAISFPTVWRSRW
jgi:hypothetical protein